MLDIRVATASETAPLRLAVLRLGEEDPMLPVDTFPGVFHLAAHIDDRIVGVVGCAPRTREGLDLNWWQLFAMAVAPSHQRMGIGRGLVLDLLARVRHNTGRGIWANSREDAVAFYESLGFARSGEAFLGWHDIRHYLVTLDLGDPDNRLPPLTVPAETQASTPIDSSRGNAGVYPS